MMWAQQAIAALLSFTLAALPLLAFEARARRRP
jgi:hypothetical protein